MPFFASIAGATKLRAALGLGYPGNETHPLSGGWAEALPLVKLRERLMRL